MKYPELIIPLLTLAVAGCAAPGTGNNVHLGPGELAQKQWQACSHYPTVELVEITADGKILVQDSSYSSPPIDYLRCISRVGYRQVQAGLRDARSLVRDAYFVDTKPEREYLYKPSGHFPDSVEKFSAAQDLYFFFVIEAPYESRPLVAFEWKSPRGEVFRTGPHRIRAKGAGARKWSFEQLDPAKQIKGRWTVRLMIEGFDAGEYFFEIV